MLPAFSLWLGLTCLHFPEISMGSITNSLSLIYNCGIIGALYWTSTDARQCLRTLHISANLVPVCILLEMHCHLHCAWWKKIKPKGNLAKMTQLIVTIANIYELFDALCKVVDLVRLGVRLKTPTLPSY